MSLAAEFTGIGPPRGAIKIDSLIVSFDGRRVAEDFDLATAPGEFVCLLGPSGCGKSTVLNAVAGFVRPTKGRILLDGVEVVAPGADRGMVFQQYSLFPWKTVLENVAFGPRMTGASRAPAYLKAREYIDLIGLTKFADAFPATLSGGMQQRVGIARALVNRPSVLLMDEPFGSLDAQNRRIMQREVRRIWEQTGRTILFVTHAIEEAVAIGTTLIMLSARPSRVRERIRNDGQMDRTKLIDDLNTMIMEEVERQQGRLDPAGGEAGDKPQPQGGS